MEVTLTDPYNILNTAYRYFIHSALLFFGLPILSEILSLKHPICGVQGPHFVGLARQLDLDQYQLLSECQNSVRYTRTP